MPPQETGCERFKIYKDRLPFSEERVCEIKGSEDSVALAISQAIEILATHPLDHDHQHYMPYRDMMNESSTGEWGGYIRFAGQPRREDFKQVVILIYFCAIKTSEVKFEKNLLENLSLLKIN